MGGDGFELKFFEVGGREKAGWLDGKTRFAKCDKLNFGIFFSVKAKRGRSHYSLLKPKLDYSKAKAIGIFARCY